MTPEETRQAAEVMLAFAEGKKIEYRNEANENWTPITDPAWAWECSDYRIAPVPWQRRIWVHDEDKSVFADEGDGWKPLAKGWRLITVKEVLA